MVGIILAPLIVPGTAEQRCQAALLFFNVLISFLLPVGLLLPLQHRRHPSPAQAEAVTVAAMAPGPAAQQQQRQQASAIERAELWLHRSLQALLWQGGREEVLLHGAGRRSGTCKVQAVAQLVRWALMLASVWAVCCGLQL